MFEDEFYEQVEGAALGSPLLATVANIYMEKFEEGKLISAGLKPTMCRTYMYVDDMFCLMDTWN